MATRVLDETLPPRHLQKNQALVYCFCGLEAESWGFEQEASHQLGCNHPEIHQFQRRGEIYWHKAIEANAVLRQQAVPIDFYFHQCFVLLAMIDLLREYPPRFCSRILKIRKSLLSTRPTVREVSWLYLLWWFLLGIAGTPKSTLKSTVYGMPQGSRNGYGKRCFGALILR